MFPNARRSEHEDLVEISWGEFFDQFEDRDLALIYEDDSRFNKLVSRDTVQRREHGERDPRGDRDHRRELRGRHNESGHGYRR